MLTLHNLGMLIRMCFNPGMWRFLHKVSQFSRGDNNYSLSALIKVALNTLQGEKIVKHGHSYIITSFLPPMPSRAYYSLITAVPEKDNIYTQQMQARRKAPLSFFLEVTDRCEYKCRHCSIQKRGHGRNLSTSQWIKIIREIQDMGTSIIGFTGGEPLLRTDMEELVGAVDDRSVSILYTNGKRLTPEKAHSLKKAGLYAVGVSLDSEQGEVHNRFRGAAGAFTGAVDAIANASDAGLYTIVQRVVLPGDLSTEALFSFFRFTKRIGAKEVRILEPIPCGNLLTEEKNYFYTEADREFLKQVQYAANRKSIFPKITTFAHTESYSQFGCGAGTQHSYISSSGELFPCDFTPLSFGNTMHEPVSNLWLRMNEVIGIPKKRCFAMDLKEKLRNLDRQAFPLQPEKSIQICLEHRNSEFPLFYRLMQGKGC